MRILRCTECRWRGLEAEIIQFPDPELAGNSWSICPKCRGSRAVRQK